VIEFLSCRPNLEIDGLAPGAAFLRELPGFEIEVDEPQTGLVLLRRDAAGLALLRSPSPGANATTAAYLGSPALMTCMGAAWPAARGSSPASPTTRGAYVTL